MPRAKHRGVAMFRDARGRGLEQHHASPRRQVSRHPLHGFAQRSGIENVLQHRDAEDEIELLACIELRQVLNQKAATIADAVAPRRVACASSIMVGLKSMPVTCAPRCGEHRAPASDAAADVQHASARLDIEPRFEREPLTGMDHAVVELGHAV